MIVKRVCTRLEYRYLHLEQLPFCSCCVFNILRVRSPKKVKNRGGLTNRQLNTYPSFYLNITCRPAKNKMHLSIKKVLVHVILKYRQENLFLYVMLAENLF